MKANQRVEIVIDELVLRGFSPMDRDGIGESLSHELSRLIEAGDIPALAGLGNIPALQAPNVTLQPGAKAATVGTQIARAVHSSLNRTASGESK